MPDEWKFWSHRRGFRPDLTGEFWKAYDRLLRRLVSATLDRYKESNGFFGDLIKFSRSYGWEEDDLESAVTELIGRDYYTPLDSSKASPKSEDHVLDFIEVFHHLALDKYKALYADEVNALFKRLNQPYELVEGHVHYRGSEVLDDPMEMLDGTKIRDQQLRKYMEAAREAFFDARKDRRLDGLRSLWDAFERLKTLREGDKKGSAAKIVAELAPSNELRPHFENLFRSYTAIGNSANIRHSERSVTLIDHDPVLIEHLFYSMWSLIRAVLQRETPGAAARGDS